MSAHWTGLEDKSCFLKHEVKEDDSREGNKTQKHEFQRDGPRRWLWSGSKNITGNCDASFEILSLVWS